MILRNTSLNSILQPLILISLNTIEVQVWHKYQALKSTRERNDYSLASNTLDTCKSQVLFVQNGRDTILSFVAEADSCRLDKLAILPDVEATSLSVRNVVLVRCCGRSAIVAIASSIAFVSLVSLVTFITFVSLGSKCIVLGFNTIFYPITIGTDSPSCTRSTCFTIFTVGDGELLTVTQGDSHTIVCFCYVCDYASILDQVFNSLDLNVIIVILTRRNSTHGCNRQGTHK